MIREASPTFRQTLGSAVKRKRKKEGKYVSAYLMFGLMEGKPSGRIPEARTAEMR